MVVLNYTARLKWAWDTWDHTSNKKKNTQSFPHPRLLNWLQEIPKHWLKWASSKFHWIMKHTHCIFQAPFCPNPRPTSKTITEFCRVLFPASTICSPRRQWLCRLSSWRNEDLQLEKQPWKWGLDKSLPRKLPEEMPLPEMLLTPLDLNHYQVIRGNWTVLIKTEKINK